MKATRKLTRFYIINPVGDRRLEQRFDSREDVVVRVQSGGRVFPGVGLDIGQYGMRLEIDAPIEPGIDVEIAFPNAPDHINCFGRVVWARPMEKGSKFEAGLNIEAWHGIVGGKNSYVRYKGNKPRDDRRNKPR